MKTQSLSQFVMRGIVGTQICFILFGLLLIFYIIPEALESTHSKELEAIVAQTKWAISKPVSYGDYVATEEYFKKIVELETVEIAALLDHQGKCLAYASEDTGCAHFDIQDLRSAQAGAAHTVRESEFYFPVLGGQREVQAKLVLVAQRRPLQQLQRKFIFYASIVILSVLLLSLLISNRSFRILRGEVLEIKARVLGLAERRSSAPKPLHLSESLEISNAVLEARDRIELLQASLREEERRAAVGDLARQVAHDIRSPLMVFEMITPTLTEIGEEKRALIRQASQRIKDIANNLLERGSELRRAEVVRPWHVLSLLDSIISEKRTAYGDLSQVELHAEFSSVAYALFLKAPLGDIKRVLSNLVNNSVEASARRVIFGAAGSAECMEIFVKDNGRGIPALRLPTLGVKGVTYGKSGVAEGGSGLGLFHAREVVESLGGQLQIESEEGQGTTIRLQLPLAARPAWFVPSLMISRFEQVVVVDDQPAIHEAWQQKLSGCRVEMIAFATATSFAEWMSAQGSGGTLFLIDYELEAAACSGLDLIERFSLQNCAILVTSRAEEADIIDRCTALRAKLLPKAMIPWVPLA